MFLCIKSAFFWCFKNVPVLVGVLRETKNCKKIGIRWVWLGSRIGYCLTSRTLWLPKRPICWSHGFELTTFMFYHVIILFWSELRSGRKHLWARLWLLRQSHLKEQNPKRSWKEPIPLSKLHRSHRSHPLHPLPKPRALDSQCISICYWLVGLRQAPHNEDVSLFCFAWTPRRKFDEQLLSEVRIQLLVKSFVQNGFLKDNITSNLFWTFF